MGLFDFFKRKKNIESPDGAAEEPGSGIDELASRAKDLGDKIADEVREAAEDVKELKGPFYIMDISIDSKLAPLTTLTLGGLKVNEETGEVLNLKGKEIRGLYAAGRTAVGVCSNIYVSGLSIADCIFSGRRIGQNLDIKEVNNGI